MYRCITGAAGGVCRGVVVLNGPFCYFSSAKTFHVGAEEIFFLRSKLVPYAPFISHAFIDGCGSMSFKHARFYDENQKV